jgi:two-component system LytT family sensor kinase
LTTRPLSVPRIQKIALGAFLAYTGIFVLLFYYMLNFSWLISFADSGITNFLLAIACIVFSNLLGFYQPKNDAVLFILVVTLVLSTFVAFLSSFLLNVIITEPKYESFLQLTMPFRFIIVFIFLAWWAMVNMLWYRLEEQSEMKERLFAAQNLAKEAELNKLRHQLQPHFLFNSLNSVYALTIVNPKEAGPMITKLASFLRGTLKRDDDIWVSVAEEMEYIQLYLAIEKVRFSHRLSIEIEVAEETMALKLPGTLLQPIVENAIKFGLYNTAAAITISIQVKLVHQLLEVTIRNPYDPDSRVEGGTGFGLSAIKRRLYLLFADPNLLHTFTVEPNIFVTKLNIPQPISQHDD